MRGAGVSLRELLLKVPRVRGWRRVVAWMLVLDAMGLLWAIRTATDAQYAFASLALLPVLAIAWFDSVAGGLLAAMLAATMWTAGDMTSTREFSAPWVPWLNAAVRLLTYGTVAVLAGVVRSLLELEHVNATRDDLTRLLNRRSLMELGEREVERARRHGRSLAIMFMDLDDFKVLNDSRGHRTGDDALLATARALGEAVRSSEGVARVGGDEFVILLPELPCEVATEAGTRIHKALTLALRPFPPVQASLGVAWFAQADRSFQEMLQEADGLMYAAKRNGKGRLLVRRFDRHAAAVHSS